MQIEEFKPTTWRELRDFVNTISDEYLDKNVPVFVSDESHAKTLYDAGLLEEDIYVSINDSDDFGTISQLMEVAEALGNEIELGDYNISSKKGMPFLWCE